MSAHAKAPESPSKSSTSEQQVTILLDGLSLTPELLVEIGYSGFSPFSVVDTRQRQHGSAHAKREEKQGTGHVTEGHVLVDLTPEAWAAVQQGRDVVDRVLARKEVVYGINTGILFFLHSAVRMRI